MLRNGSKSLKISSVGLLMPLVMSLAATLMQPSAAQAGGFSNTCRGKQLVLEPKKVLLKAECADKDGKKHPSSLVISDYVANYGGNLSWDRNSNFQASCPEIQLRQLLIYRATSPLPSPPYSVLLQASCEDGKGGYKRSFLELDEKISNQNGVLAVDSF